jgi:2-haloacid dehalogenase
MDAQLDPQQIDALVFDVIGTLVDDDTTWAAAAHQLAAGSGVDDGQHLLARWVETLDREMDAVVRGDEAWRSHRELVSDCARQAVASLGGDPHADALDAVSYLDDDYAAWPEVAAATAALRRDRLVAGVSNGDLDALARLANSSGISWDMALSTAAVGTFKPDPAAYRYAIETLRIDPSRTLFVAAHPWDLRAASEHGFRTAYIARPGAKRPTPDDRFDVACDDLTVLVDVLDGSARR